MKRTIKSLVAGLFISLVTALTLGVLLFAYFLEPMQDTIGFQSAQLESHQVTLKYNTERMTYLEQCWAGEQRARVAELKADLVFCVAIYSGSMSEQDRALEERIRTLSVYFAADELPPAVVETINEVNKAKPRQTAAVASP